MLSPTRPTTASTSGGPTVPAGPTPRSSACHGRTHQGGSATTRASTRALGPTASVGTSPTARHNRTMLPGPSAPASSATGCARTAATTRPDTTSAPSALAQCRAGRPHAPTATAADPTTSSTTTNRAKRRSVPPTNAPTAQAHGRHHRRPHSTAQISTRNHRNGSTTVPG
jgi:hypothetical protein